MYLYYEKSHTKKIRHKQINKNQSNAQRTLDRVAERFCFLGIAPIQRQSFQCHLYYHIKSNQIKTNNHSNYPTILFVECASFAAW